MQGVLNYAGCRVSQLCPGHPTLVITNYYSQNFINTIKNAKIGNCLADRVGLR